VTVQARTRSRHPRSRGRRGAARTTDEKLEPTPATTPNPPKNDKGTLVRVFLAGYFVHDKNGLPQRRYLSKDEEVEARAVLAQLFRSGRPLSREFRDILATLFDPRPKAWPPIDHPGICRKLVFQRQRGATRLSSRDTTIAQGVKQNLRKGIKTGEALEAVARQYRMEKDAVREIWAKYRIFEEYL
jgi:hypothetical protein